MKYLFLITIILSTLLSGNYNNTVIANPKSTVYDFTFQSNDDLSEKDLDTVYEKKEYQVSKILGKIPRSFFIENCINNVCLLDAVDCIKKSDGTFESPYPGKNCYDVGNGKYKSSILSCNSESKCGIASCKTYNISNDTFMPYIMHPIKSNYQRENLENVNCIEKYEYDDGISTYIEKDVYVYSNKIPKTVTNLYPAITTTSNILIKECGIVPIGCVKKSEFKECSNGEEGFDYSCTETITKKDCLDNDLLSGDNCIKTEVVEACPEEYSETIGEDIINGECKKYKDSYSYYTYQCKDNSWTLINQINDPGCIDDTFGGCVNFDLEKNNCKKPLDNCLTIEEIKTCIDVNCDLVENNNISYCLNEVCPSSQNIYERDGKCFALGCPEGTIEINNICMEK